MSAREEQFANLPDYVEGLGEEVHYGAADRARVAKDRLLKAQFAQMGLQERVHWVQEWKRSLRRYLSVCEQLGWAGRMRWPKMIGI